jgi:DNA uptake protein ComE-like DNA-binding protein
MPTGRPKTPDHSGDFMKRLLSVSVIVLTASTLAACGGDADTSDDIAELDPMTETSAPAATPPAAGSADAGGDLIDPETATREQLISAGVDAGAADAIVAARPIEDMTEVDGILEAQMDSTQRAEVYRRVWKRIDLNSASEEEILLIPGVGQRMRHEFEEYRPYQAMEQFRREMGKYVDDEEVARLEQYVEIR